MTMNQRISCNKFDFVEMGKASIKSSQRALAIGFVGVIQLMTDRRLRCGRYWDNLSIQQESNPV